MTLWYVVPSGYTGSVPAGYTQVTPTSVTDRIEAAPGDTVLVSSSYSGDINIAPSTGVDGAPLNVSVEETTQTVDINFTDPVSAGSFSPTVTIPDGVHAPNVSIDGTSTEVISVDVGQGAALGDIATGGGNDTVTVGDGSVVGHVYTGSGDDTITITGATVTGDVVSQYGDDVITISDSTIQNGVAGDRGSDSITITNSFISTQLAGGDFGGDDSGDDTMSIADSTIDGWISTGGGDNQVTISGYTAINGTNGSNSVAFGIGDDSLLIGRYVSTAGFVYGGTGDDTVSVIADDNDADLHALNAVLNAEGYATTFRDTTPVEYTHSTDVDRLIYEFDWDGTWFTDWDYAAAVCFASGTMIETDRGEVAIEDLAEGDLVMTRDNGLQPIRWMGRRVLSAELMSQYDKLRPIRIRAGALGKNTPKADLLVSPQHRVLVRSKIAQKMFGAREVLVAAKQLCLVEGIDVAEDVVETTYFHMLFDRHEVVFSNGAETESLFTGPEALKGVGPAAVEEIFAIFPQLRDRDYTPVAARPLASGRMGRKLAVRHAQNSKLLVK